MNPKIIDKLKKLLRLSKDQGATPAEAAAALSAALKLSREHRIPLSEINPDECDDRGPITHTAAKCKAVGMAEKLACSICRDFFHVEQLSGRRSMTFIGLPHDVEIATHVFTFLVRCFRGSWTIARARDKRLNRDTFLQAMAYAIIQKLRELEKHTESPPEESALAPSVNAYIAEHFGAVRTSKIPSGSRRAHRSWQRGFDAGQGVEIHPAVNGSGSTPAIENTNT